MIMQDGLLIIHMIGLAMAVGVGFAFMALGIGTKGMEATERTRFMLRAFIMSKVSSMGLALLLLSGIGLLATVPGVFARGGAFFHTKLTLVVILLGVFGFLQVKIKKAKKANGGPAMAIIPKLGGIMNLLGIAIIVLAVLAFH